MELKTFKKYTEYSSLCEILELSAKEYSSLPAITDEYNGISMTYEEMDNHINLFAGGIQSLGLQKGDFVSLFSENNGRWIIIDQALLRCGVVDAVRGSNAPVDELDYIIGHSDSKCAILKDVKLFNKIKDYLPKHNLKFVVLLFKEEEFLTDNLNCPVYTYDDIIELGRKNPYRKVEIKPDDNLTLIYTSGTTGNPKGVLLTHKNYIYQVVVCHNGFRSKAGENTLQILPIWHAYERVGQYYYFACGCHLHFTTLTGLKGDLKKYKIDTMMSVPRIWEALRHGIFQTLKQKTPNVYNIFKIATIISMAFKESLMYLQRRITNKRIYSPITMVMAFLTVCVLAPLHCLFKYTLYRKIKQKAGLNLRASISGGGSLTMQDEYFYDAIGVNLRIGYGLTETAPVITIRHVGDKNFLGCAGSPILDTEIKIIDPVTFKELKKFKKGLILVRGPQIMKEYYKDPISTKQIIDKDGWLNTGDLGWLTNENNLVIVGRLKETIVLSTGENVEPVPIEEACLSSPFIEQIVLVGQDKNGVGALVIPSKEALAKCGISIQALQTQKTSAIENEKLKDLIKHEINTYIKDKPKLKPFEKIIKFELLKDTFSIDNGLLTQSGKTKRNNVFEKYKDLIAKMYK